MDSTALKVIYLVLSPKVPWKAGKDDMGITWLRSEICPILLITTTLKALSQQGMSAGGGTCMVRLLCDKHALGSLLRLEYMYDMQLVVSYMVTRCNGVSSL